MCSHGSLVTNTFGYTSRPGPTEYAEFLIFIAIAPTKLVLAGLKEFIHLMKTRSMIALMVLAT